LNSKRTSVFYESPHRIIKTLNMIKELSETSNINKKIVVAREITKLFEQIVSGDIDKVIKYFEDNPDKVKGEFAIVVS
jgi:16S rRNA (cytidine1402-2'-O)-methyltransferase